MICGHNHVVFRKDVNDSLIVVNTGSAGAPFDGDWRPAFLIAEQLDDGWHFRNERVEYDKETAASAFSKVEHAMARFMVGAILDGKPTQD